MGLWEVVLVFMSLTGFGVQKDAAAPPAAEVLKYAPDDAEVMFYADVAAVLPSNYDAFTKLQSDANIKQVPELQGELGQLIAQAEGGRQMVKAMAGFDPVNDVKSVTGFASMHGALGTMPDFVVVARGTFPADLADRIDHAAPKGSHKIEKVDGRTLLVASDGHAAAGLAADGSFVFGTPAWVRQRVAKGWKSKIAKGSLADRASAVLDTKPFLYVATHFSPATQKSLDGELHHDDEGLVRDLLDGQDFASVALFSDGVGWSYTAKSAAGYQRAIMASDGLVMILRSLHMFTRGVADVALASLDSYASNPTVAQLVAHKADLLKLVDTWTGDGQFTANVDKKDAENRLTVTLTGKSLSEVLPITGLVVPGAAAALFLSGHRKMDESQVEFEKKTAEPVQVAPTPRSK